MEENAPTPTGNTDSSGAAINCGAFLTGQTGAGDEPTADTGGMLINDRDRDDCASMKSDDDALSETEKSTCSYPFSSPNPSEQDDGTDHDRKRGSNKAHRRQGAESSTSTPRHVYPMSMRQQLALLKQMDPPSESPKSPASQAHTTPTSTGKSRRIAKVHKKNDRGETPLHVAARKGEYRQCRRLLNAGAVVGLVLIAGRVSAVVQVNSADYAGWTALHEACSHGRLKVAKVLIKGGADVNATGLDDESPLHDAAYNGNKQLVWLLLQHGADKNKANKEGKLPIDLCEDEEVKKLLTGDRPVDSPPDSPESATSDSGNDRGDGLSVASSPKHELLHESTSDSAILMMGGAGSPLQSSTTWPDLANTNNDTVDMPSDSKSVEGGRDPATESDGGDTTLTPGRASMMEVDAAPTTDLPETQEQTSVENTEPILQTENTQMVVEEERSRTPVGKRRASEQPEDDTPTSSKQPRTDSPDKSWAMVRSMRRRDQMRHQRFHQQQQRFQSAIADKKRRGAPSGGLTRSPRGRRRAGGVGPRQRGSRQNSPDDKVDDVYEFHSSSESEEQQTLSLQRERKASDRRTEQLQAEQQQADQLATSRSADVTPTPMDPAATVAQVSNSAPSTPTTTAVHHSKKGRLLGLPALVPTVDQNTEPVADPATVSVTEFDDATENDRKVPPLRISLTKTPSEEDGQSGPMDTARARSAEPAEQQPPAKVAAKNASSDGSGNGQETKAQRLTRSKVRAQGLQLDDAERGSGVNLHPHKRKGPWRRPVVVAPSAALVEPATTAATAAWSCSSSDSAASLLTKNSYEGFRLMRRLIENGWSSLDANRNQPISRPYQPPLHYENFLVNKKSYLLQRTYEAPKVESTTMEGLSDAMRQLFSKQQQHRDNLIVEHRIQRDRLRLFCEKETLRLRARAANANRPPLSAVRVVRESEIYNPLMVDRTPVTPKETTEAALTVAQDALMTRMGKQKTQLLNRQKMEADSLLASQKMCWESELKKIGELDFGQKWRFDSALVPRVAVSDTLDLLPSS